MRVVPVSFCFGLLLSMCSVIEGHAEGALAVGSDGRGGIWFGASANSQSVREAQASAMARCQTESGRPCSIADTFRNVCIAIAMGTDPGRSGLNHSARVTLADAQSAAFAACRARFSRCEIRASFCDNIDEAAAAYAKRQADEITAELANKERADAEAAAWRAQVQAAAADSKRQADEIAAELANKERANAEAAAWRAKQELAGAEAELARIRADTQWAEQSKYRAQTILTDVAQFASTSVQYGIAKEKVLGMGVATLLAIIVLLVKIGFPKTAGFAGVLVPGIIILIYLFTGLELKEEITLLEWPFLTLFGGALVAAILYKINA